MSVNKLSQKRLVRPVLGVPSIYFGKVNSWLDACILALIALIGLLGTIYLFKSTSGHYILQRLDPQEAHYQENNQETKELVFEEYDSWKPCVVEGAPIVGSELQFTVLSYREDATYTADFGNGEKQVIQDDQFMYSYENPGQYSLTLEVNFKGESKTLFTEMIEISSLD